MTQVIELYPKEVRESDLGAREGYEEFANLATSFGFHRLAAERVGRPSDTRQWLEANGVKPLLDDELAAWREYLPTSYWSRTEKAQRNFQEERILGFEDYAFHEGVPLSVLRRMKDVHRLFDVLEIRTPEVPQRIAVSDPVLWGHILYPNGSRAVYPLARWAESDANFIANVGDVKKILHARHGFTTRADLSSSNVRLEHVIECLFAGFFGGILAAIAVSYSEYSWQAFSACIALGGCVSLIDIVAQLWRLRALRKSDPQLARFV